MDDGSEICPLCGGVQREDFHRDQRRDYFRCLECGLVYVPSSQRLTPAEEKSEYDLHENDPHDPGYRRFLSRVFEPLTQAVAPPAWGLDFGCGPGPALPLMLEEAGYEVSLYDIFYAPDASVFLPGAYDFITATEVFEHLFEPGQEIARLWTLLRSGGVLAVMTKRVIDREAFANWHYKNDPTHVVFFSEQSFHWLARRLDARLQLVGKDVALLEKRAPD